VLVIADADAPRRAQVGDQLHGPLPRDPKPRGKLGSAHGAVQGAQRQPGGAAELAPAAQRLVGNGLEPASLAATRQLPAIARHPLGQPHARERQQGRPRLVVRQIGGCGDLAVGGCTAPAQRPDAGRL
jgi:hypothetical protein